ncbi:benzoquinone reductase [Jaapia argillacea MUCL 33604]|uniref:Benzoquinone reductase n=1 Tax=Jaapia argillacea MUCL 33604 TaxID=933084 RepID=A0A067Q0H5_9AGAM|nr:benzoquinone reductase [Jaapia argillacea MUCL 33604]
MIFPFKRQKSGHFEKGEKRHRPSTPSKVPPVPAPEVAVAPAYTPTPALDITGPGRGPKVAIIIYSMYGHISKLAEAEKAGIESAGGSAEIFQIPETLSDQVLAKMRAPPKQPYPVINPAELATFDAFLFGIPTRFGNFPAQWKAFWDATGSLWATGALAGKYAGMFISTASLGGGQESTAIAAMSTLIHHGMIFVPLGYKYCMSQLASIDEVRGGSPWGSGTFASPDGQRMPSPLEIEVANIQGKSFYDYLARVKF